LIAVQPSEIRYTAVNYLARGSRFLEIPFRLIVKLAGKKTARFLRW
jgi:hypothetical protein